MLINEYLNLNRISGIYCIICLMNNKKYIGSSVNIRKRLSTHFNQLRKRNHCNDHLQSAFNLYKKENFIIEILEEIIDLNILIDREQYWINFYRTYDRKNGFNWGQCAKHPLMGMKHSEISKKKISQTRLLKKYTMSQDHKNKLSKLLKGKALSEERKNNIREGAILAHDKEKKYIELVNPEGQIIKRLGLRSICKEFGFNRSAISKFLLSGKNPTYKGWRLYKKNTIYLPISTKRYIADSTREKIRQSRLGKTFKKECN